MVQTNTRKALSELNSIIKVLPEELKEKIPDSFLSFIKENMDLSYEFSLKEPFEKNKFLKETEIMLGLMYENYWCSEIERQAYLKHDSEELLKKKESVELKLNSDFRQKKDEEALKEENNLESLVVKKETILSKAIKWIKNILNIKD